MPEFEDMILPDDFQMDSPQSEEVTETVDTQEEQTESIEDTNPIEEASEPVEEPQKLKIKYNHQEEEITLDEAVQLAQMGKNYPKLQEKLQALESDPRLAFVEDLAQQFNMSVPEYLEAVTAQREQQRIQELVEKGISEEVAQEMLENRNFRQKYEAEQRAKAEEAKQNQEYMEFFDYFREVNGRDFNPSQDKLPESVLSNKEIPLKFAYMAHENNQLRQQLQTLKQNESNKQKAPIGSVTAHGSNEVASEDLFMQGFNSI